MSKKSFFTRDLMSLFRNNDIVLENENQYENAVQCIQDSGAFDEVFYLEAYPDVKEADVEPIIHYVYQGVVEGRNPNKDFDTSYYLQAYPDVKASGINPFVHYILHGKEEKRFQNDNELQVFNRLQGQNSESEHDLSYSQDEMNLQIILESDLFDAKYYCSLYTDIAEISALEHYYFQGWKEGRNPSFLFDTNWYLQQNIDVKNSNMHPLLHYILNGDKEDRLPSVYFNKSCILHYLKQDDLKQTSLAFFYKNEKKLKLNPNSFFDIDYYLNHNSDIVNLDISPFFHFLNTGVYEGRFPREDIDISEYVNRYGVNKDEINPFRHFVLVSGEEYLQSKTAISMPLSNDFRQKGPYYENVTFDLEAQLIPKVKALAYYLPQFYPFEENDAWWGKGFTEWSNVTRGLPRFNGHYQPHLPSYLGYYDLRVKEVMAEQIKLAKGAGIYGFCFYYYWFNGKRLMNKPVDMLLENKELDMPFCLMWANENWTRTWDGLNNDVLIKQDYLEEDDEDFIFDVCKHFIDKRYIRIDGRPLFFIYRPNIIPNAKQRIARWRFLCKELLNEEPIFYMAHAFDQINPFEYGMDGAIEFPPHKVAEGLEDVSRSKGVIDDEFSGHYPAYDALVEASLKLLEQDEDLPYPLIKGVTPTWDNEARKRGRGYGFVDSTPKKYEYWLKQIIQYAKNNPIAENQSFVVINAWNEWAEGAHLEPDIYWGSAYLNATYRAMHNISELDGKFRLILVGHDAYKHGAQLLTLNIFKTLKRRFGTDVVCVLLNGGPLVSEYKDVAKTYVGDGTVESFNQILSEINDKKLFEYAICNTTVTGECVESLKKQNFKVVSLVHELPTLIHEYNLTSHAEKISECADNVIFAADFVKHGFESIVGELGNKAIVRPQGLYQHITEIPNAKEILIKKLNLPDNINIVMNCGFADLRKGFDLFIQIAKLSIQRDDSYHFLWLGDVEKSLNDWVLNDIKGSVYEKNIHILPFTNEISLYLNASDVFAMTSREDPFPSVVLEAFAVGTPVIAFENSGGVTEILEDSDFGRVVPTSDCHLFSSAIDDVMTEDSASLKQKRIRYITSSLDWSDYVFNLLEFLNPDLKRLSVVVPNYNYENHLEDRLTSIFKQEYPIYELIVLDDKSPDGSVEIIKSLAKVHKREVSLIVNEQNSGSVFKQWRKGIELASCDYLWIAEADDSAEPEFLSTIMQGQNDFTLAYTDSRQIDQNNELLAEDYHYYYDGKMIEKLENSGIYNGAKILSDCLSIKNQFMNVSSIVFDRKSVKAVFDEHMSQILEYKVAGDWFVYVRLLSEVGATCKMIGSSLNIHRRHQGSVTRSNYDVQLKEITGIQKMCAHLVDVDEKLQTDYLIEVKKVLGE